MERNIRESCGSSSSTVMPPPPAPKQGTSSRPKVYLLEKLESSLSFARLPKAKSVLSRFLDALHTKNDPNLCAKEAACEVKRVWEHHFSTKVIFGRDNVDDEEDSKRKMIIHDQNIKDKILKIWKEWKDLERTSKRSDRASTQKFKEKEAKFVSDVLDMPLQILKGDYQNVLEKSGIRAWKEDLDHLHNQYQRNQLGSLDGIDKKQEKKDKRKEMEMLREKARKEQLELDEKEKLLVDGDMEEDQSIQESPENLIDPNFYHIGGMKKDGKKKIDIMGPISHTADRLGLSVRERCMMAASVVNALGQNIEETNISKSSAWERTKKERIKKS